MITRRDFLGRTAAGVSFVSLSGAMPGLFARAAESASSADRNDHVLVVVELAGGNDGLNTLIPFENDLYYKNRPTLGIPNGEVLKLTDQLGLHPAMGPGAELFKSGKLAIVQGVGYPEPNRSHFRSMEIWHTASTSTKVPLTGWLGRILDERFAPGEAESLRGLSFSGALPQAFQSDKHSVAVIQQLEAFAGAPGEQAAREKLLRKLSTTPATGNDTVGFLRAQSETVFRTAEKLRDAAAKYKSEVMYPGALGEQLRRAAQIITADLGVRLLFVSQGGYDTHNQQAGAHAALVGELAGALAAFQQDIEKQKVADKVLVMVFSEFGRRVDENASRGTDHGAASCMFLAGSKVKAGLSGEHPSLEKLGDGDLIHTVDFRSVYATVLDRWLGCPSEKLLGEKFATPDLIAT
jgi:uncharacterized protein (DUF1501 family)